MIEVIGIGIWTFLIVIGLSIVATAISLSVNDIFAIKARRDGNAEDERPDLRLNWYQFLYLVIIGFELISIGIIGLLNFIV